MLPEGYLTTDDGVRLFFRTAGSGPAVFLPNGMYLFDDFQGLAARRTLFFYDVRNRGRSDSISDAAKLQKGILQDADDLEAVRRHFGIDRIDLMAHSYMGLIVALYAMKYPDHLNRAIQLGPMQPDAGKQYPAHLTCEDATLANVITQLAQLKNDDGLDPQAVCERFWRVLRPIYVVDPTDAGKIRWGRCELANERNARRYWSEHIFPSIQGLRFSAQKLAHVRAPVLVIHGNKDRSSPYGGGRDWAAMFPNARLVTVENAAHAPWIESPELVFGSIETFLDGEWPEVAL